MSINPKRIGNEPLKSLRFQRLDGEGDPLGFVVQRADAYGLARDALK